MARREIQVFNMSFLDMMTNFLGAVIILFLLAAQNVSKSPGSGMVRKVEGSFDQDRLIVHGQVPNAALGDTLMLILKDNDPVLRSNAIASIGNSGIGRREERKYVDTTGMRIAKLPVNQRPEAIFIESATTSDCNDARTTDKTNDDTYTITLKALKLGKASSGYTVDGRTATYQNQVVLGPYKMSEGKKKLVVKDAMDGILTKEIEINPPTPCKSNVPPPPPPPLPAAPKVPGKVNFYVSWEDPNDKVNIYVRKGRKWVFGGRPSDSSIGEFSELRSNTGPFNRKNTNVETVRQMNQFIPGVYEVYAHLREDRRSKTKEIPISLWIINEKFPYESKEYTYKLNPTDNNPRNSGGKLLKTVEITTEGKFIIR